MRKIGTHLNFEKQETGRLSQARRDYLAYNLRLHLPISNVKWYLSSTILNPGTKEEAHLNSYENLILSIFKKALS